VILGTETARRILGSFAACAELQKEVGGVPQIRRGLAVRSLNDLGTPPCDSFEELENMKTGAGNGIRTRDPDLGKVVLYH
jgi:hypothetical protein